ncbi:hypothetical protein SAZ10_28915, partial [Mesorhizobium sp. BAC0120]|uniref:hypothetical protein n=1 Tax=Mesorhizobium sp. BAC0120 TaxID=3090670 RepID=UPI00298C63EB
GGCDPTIGANGRVATRPLASLARPVFVHNFQCKVDRREAPRRMRGLQAAAQQEASVHSKAAVV